MEITRVISLCHLLQRNQQRNSFSVTVVEIKPPFCPLSSPDSRGVAAETGQLQAGSESTYQAISRTPECATWMSTSADLAKRLSVFAAEVAPPAKGHQQHRAGAPERGGVGGTPEHTGSHGSSQ